MRILILVTSRLGRYAIPFLATILFACQSTPPVAYIEQIVVEGYLFANHHVDSIVVARSLPVNQLYVADSAGISDAQVSISVDDVAYPLFASSQTPGSYYLMDSSFIVRSGKTYLLTVQYKDNTITSQTTVPDSIKITQQLPDTIQYPQDTINVLNYSAPFVTWTGVNSISYAASITCTDTLWYDSLHNIHNRRVWHLGDGSGGTQYNDITRWSAFLPVSSVPVPWTIYKWYGKQKITAYALDKNFNDWLKMTELNGGTFTQDLNHINGGVGVFASAGIDTTTTFLKMP